MFHDVRRRTLPAAARSLYTKAKTSYDGKRWAEAKVEFEGLLTLLGDPDLAAQRTALADLQQLGEGFLKLADNELSADAKSRRDAEAAEQRRRADAEAAQRAAAARAAAEAASRTPVAPAGPAPNPATRPRTTESPRPPAPAAAPATRPAAAESGPVYTTSDRDVTPPAEQRRAFPRWSPPNRMMATTTQTGLLEIVVDEKGAVTSARMAKLITPGYDAALTSAARDWRFTPAQKDGQPVRYRLLLEVVLRPPQ